LHEQYNINFVRHLQEVQIFTDKITILSYPGPMPPVSMQILSRQKIVARDYRNRRIGDFLKELDLTEGRGTGFPKIYRKMENNSSPQPIIETDEQGSYFMVTLPINLKYADAVNGRTDDTVSNGVNEFFFKSLADFIAFGNGVSNGAKQIITEELHDKVEEILKTLIVPQSRGDLFKSIDFRSCLN
jgi:ATP-dependent DNA helicase RecG